MTEDELREAGRWVPEIASCPIVRVPEPARWERAAHVLAATLSSDVQRALGERGRPPLEVILWGLQLSSVAQALRPDWWTAEAASKRGVDEPSSRLDLLGVTRKLLAGRFSALRSHQREAILHLVGGAEDVARFVDVALMMGFKP